MARDATWRTEFRSSKSDAKRRFLPPSTLFLDLSSGTSRRCHFRSSNAEHQFPPPERNHSPPQEVRAALEGSHDT